MATRYPVPKEVLTWRYYYDKIPLYLKNSYGFPDFIRALWEPFGANALYPDEQLTPNAYIFPSGSAGIAAAGEALLDMLDIYGAKNGGEPTAENANKYLEFINSLEGAENGTKSAVLDNLGAIFGLYRSFEITDPDNAPAKIKLELNNREFLMLIKAQFAKAHYDGTYRAVREFYDRLGLTVSAKSAGNAVCALTLYKISGISETTTNIEKMFKADLLTLPSVGITYTHQIVTPANLAIFDDAEHGFDVGVFL